MYNNHLGCLNSKSYRAITLNHEVKSDLIIGNNIYSFHNKFETELNEPNIWHQR